MKVRGSNDLSAIEERMGKHPVSTHREFASVGNKKLHNAYGDTPSKDHTADDPTEIHHPAPQQPAVEADLEEAVGPYNAGNVERSIKGDLNQWIGQVDDLMGPGDDEAQIIADTIVSDREGNQVDQITAMYDALELPIPDEDDPEYEDWLEFGFEKAEEDFDRIADQLNSRMKLPGMVSFGWHEGGYYMFYRWEPEDHPELIEGKAMVQDALKLVGKPTGV